MSEKNKYFSRRRKKAFAKKQLSSVKVRKTPSDSGKSDNEHTLTSQKSTAPSVKQEFGESAAAQLKASVQNLLEGLLYPSESEAEIKFFVGLPAPDISAQSLQNNFPETVGRKITEQNIGSFFDNLTKIETWFSPEDRQTAAQFEKLREILEENLTNLSVFTVGRTNIDIYVAGLNVDGVMCGLITTAVET